MKNMSEQSVMLQVKDYHSDTGKKVWKIFEKLKRKADLARYCKVRSDPRLGEYDDESYFYQLRRDAMKSLHLLPNEEKSEEGFEVT